MKSSNPSKVIIVPRPPVGNEGQEAPAQETTTEATPEEGGQTNEEVAPCEHSTQQDTTTPRK